MPPFLFRQALLSRSRSSTGPIGNVSAQILPQLPLGGKIALRHGAHNRRYESELLSS